MSKLLEIFGKGIGIDVVELIWNWINAQNPSGPHSSDITVQMEKIIDCLASRNLAQAEQLLRLYLFEKPNCPLGRMAAAAVCIQQNDIEGAIEQSQSVYYRTPSNTLALYILGFCHERLERIPQAVEFYQDCLKFKSYLQLPRQRLGAIYLSEGRLDKVIEEYTALTCEHPEDIQSQVLLGYLYMAARRYEQASETFNLAIISHPDNFNQEGADDEFDDLLQHGMHDEAIEKIRFLIEQVGLLPDLLIRLGDICSKAGRMAEAIAHYENALRMQPNSLEATIKLGTQYLKERHLTLAAEQFNQAAEINDEIIDAYIGLAISQYLAGHHEEAVQSLELSSTIHQNSVLLFAETAVLHYEANRLLDADMSDANAASRDDIIRQLTHLWSVRLSRSKGNADIYYKYAVLQGASGDVSESIRWFKKALGVNPTHYRARTKLALACLEKKQVQESLDILTDVAVFAPVELALHYQTSLLFCDKVRFAKAFHRIQTSSFSSACTQDTRDNLEVILENLGLIDRAISNWSSLEETAQLAASSIGKRNPDLL